MLSVTSQESRTLTLAAMLCEDETISTALTAVPACDSRAAVALSSLFMTFITHTAITVTVTRFAGLALKLWEAKPPIAAPVSNSRQLWILKTENSYHFSSVRLLSYTYTKTWPTTCLFLIISA
jgi:hypothetical protein